MSHDEIDNIRGTLFNHTHTGADFTQKLRNQDFNLIARNTLSAEGTTLTVTGISPKKFLRVYVEYGARSGNGNVFLRCNNVSSASYTFIENGNNTARTSQ